MQFALSQEQRMVCDLAEAFSRDEIAPIAARMDREATFPMEVHRKAHELGLIGVTIPQEYGGHGLGTTELVLISEAFAHGCVGVATSLGLNPLVTEALVLAGTERQKRTYLGRMADGGFACWGLTEPAAGSDVAGITTRARRVGGDYVINGGKVWITNASLASFILAFAKTDPDAGHKGMTAFLIERDTPGVEVSQPLSKMGQKASPTCEIHFSDVVVPAANILGNENDGFRLAMKSFDKSRPMVGAFAVGLIRRCLDESMGYARERRTMGCAIIDHQVIGHRLADMRIKLEASRLLTLQSAWLADMGQSNTLEASCAKAFACDAAMWAATEAVQIHGGMGYSTEFPVEKLFRDAKILQIYEGTSEIQRNIILREMRK
ncbi:acyl-CoA dehydrogenase family protein [Magnetospirillum sp. 15-1]|uniref:acyl-CoA dehydrogenase family protein n=1 Tax=Magnetospirillum sp. 15-1 TaxID=1979370 RepID=UPI000BBB6F3E|nr:acyl-CoA dehydrogenase family protein [Magnetospirillum sp. 15-1]